MLKVKKLLEKIATNLKIISTGATFRIFNAGSNPRGPSIQWIAIGGVLHKSIFNAFSHSRKEVATC